MKLVRPPPPPPVFCGVAKCLQAVAHIAWEEVAAELLHQVCGGPCWAFLLLSWLTHRAERSLERDRGVLLLLLLAM